MNSPFQLGNEDLARLADFFPSLSFEREEQVRALLHSDSRDFQAAPGSGKTTLLGAKLSLMAARWPHERRGICILTHTNVAREEIQNCLRAVPQGERLLAYPHFIGTIQSFVNRFLALPWLRALGIEVREIDDEDFETRFVRRALADYSVRVWVAQSEYQRESSIRGARYRGASLNLITNAQTSLPAKGAVIDRLRTIKTEMMLEGRVRHEDMFALAEQAFQLVLGLADSVEYRFPNVFIDEMQDTSDIQLEVLTKVFGPNASVQRFGDINQSILCRGPRTSKFGFPATDSLEVKTSLRFGVEIAGIANSVKAVGAAILGEGPPCLAPPTLFLYSDSTVSDVIGRFGAWLAPLISQEELNRYPVKAVCAIKRVGNPKQVVGRHIRDYYPDYDDTVGKPASSRRSMCGLLRIASDVSLSSSERRVSAARAAVLLALGEFGRDELKTDQSWRECMRLIGLGTALYARVQVLVLDIVQGEYPASTKPEVIASVISILNALSELVVRDASSYILPDSWFEESNQLQSGPTPTNCLLIQANGIEIPVHIATIAAVKGETHLATLVLESCHDRKYDLESVLPFLCGNADASVVNDENLKNRLMNVFVGASRPRRLLAFAMHVDRVNADSRANLKARGWDVIDWTC